MKYVDEKFGPEETIFFGEESKTKQLEVINKQLLILKLIPWGFYPMLLYQDKAR